MKTKKNLSVLLAMAIALLFYIGCTSNPVGDDNIGDENKQISGSVQLDSDDQPERVYVWLEGFNRGVYTDTDGEFTLTLPAGENEDVTGVFKLYFFVANYKLDTEEVAVRKGVFIYNQAGLNSEGRLLRSKILEPFLFIKSSIEPESMKFGAAGNINIGLELRTNSSISDSVTVVFPKTTAGFLGPVFFQNIDTQELFIFETLPAATQEVVIIGSNPSKRSASLTFLTLNLPVAKYVVIPFMHIAHEEIPSELLDSIGSNLKELSPNYLKLPFVRQGGYIEVEPAN